MWPANERQAGCLGATPQLTFLGRCPQAPSVQRMTATPFSAIRRPVENDSSKTSCSACGPWWRLPLLLGLVLTAIVWSRVHRLRDESPEKSIDRPAPLASGVPQQKVELTVDFGGRQKDFAAIPWHPGITVADAMKASSGLAVTQRGSGQSAFVTAID